MKEKVKLRAGKRMVPVTLTYEEGDIYFAFPYNKALLAEIKLMEGRHWCGYDTPPRKVWRVPETPHNLFQLEYLKGGNPYSLYDEPIPENTFTRPLFDHQKAAVDFILKRRQAILAAEMGCVSGDAVVRVKYKHSGNRLVFTLKELFNFFHHVRFPSSVLSIETIGRDGKAAWTQIINVIHKGTRPTIRLTFKGHTLKVTPDHAISSDYDGFKAAGTLQNGSIVRTTRNQGGSGFLKVRGIQPCDDCEVYDVMCAAPLHSFLANSVQVHNCLAGDTEVSINRGGKGFRITLEELYHKFRGGGRWNLSIPTKIRSLCGDSFRLNKVEGVLYKGIQSVVKVTLTNGNSVRATADHEFYTEDMQLVPAAKLEQGTRLILSAREQPLQTDIEPWRPLDRVDPGTYEPGYQCKRRGLCINKHVEIMERYLGRDLDKTECVHHINGRKDDNRFENLQLMKDTEHRKMHGSRDGYLNFTGGYADFQPETGVVVSVEEAGETEVYDIICADPYRNFLANGVVCANCGKTLAAIEVMERSGSNDWWYVAPRSALKAVEREFATWDLKINPRMMTYEGMTKEMENWDDGRLAPFGVIGDEITRAKNPTAKRSRAALALADGIRADHPDGFVVLMSGSPAPKSPRDWWHIAKIARPGYLLEGNVHQFRERLAIMEQKEGAYGQAYPHIVTWLDDEEKCKFCGQYKDDHDSFDEDTCKGFAPSINEVAKLHKRLQGLTLVQFKKDCLDLPDKYYRRIELEVTPKMARVAEALAASAKTVVSGLILLRELSDGFTYKDEVIGKEKCPLCAGSGEQANPLLLMDSADLPEGCDLRPIVACDGCAGKGERRVFSRKTIQVETPKEAALVDLLDEYSDVGRLVTYGAFTGTIDRIVSIAEASSWEWIRVDGRGWHSSVEGDPLENFQDKLKEHPRILFIGQPGAAGMGLTLTASPAIVYYSNDFDAEHRIQSEDRIHRPGMDVNRGATIIDLLHLQTDYLVLDNLQAKRKLQAISLGDVRNCLRTRDD